MTHKHEQLTLCRFKTKIVRHRSGFREGSFVQHDGEQRKEESFRSFSLRVVISFMRMLLL